MGISRVKLILLILLPAIVYGQDVPIRTTIINQYEDSFKGKILLEIEERNRFSWNMHVVFDEPVFNLQVWRASVVNICQDNRVYLMTNRPWNGNLVAGSTLDINFVFSTETNDGVLATVIFNSDTDYCSGPLPTSPPVEPTVEPTEIPIEPTEAPVEPTEPVDFTEAPVEPTEVPVVTVETSVEPTESPVEPTEAGGETITICETCMSDITITNRWSGNFQGFITVIISNSVTTWNMEIHFSEPVDTLTIYQAVFTSSSDDKMIYYVTNQNYNGEQSEGATLSLEYQASYSGSEPSFLIIRSMTDQPECCTEVPVTVPIATAAPGEGCRTCCSTTAVTSEWQGNFNGEFTIPITKRVTGGWTVEIYFSTAVNSLNVYNGNVIGTLKGNTVYQISNAQHNGDLEPGSENYIDFHGTISGNDAPDFYVYMVGQPQCCDTLCETSEVTDAPQPQETDVPLPSETPVEPTEASVEPTETLIEPTEAPVEPTESPVEPTEAVGETITICETCMSDITITNRWSGHFQGTITVIITNSVNTWNMEIHFSEPVDSLDIYEAMVTGSSDDKMTYYATNENYNGEKSEGETLTSDYQASYTGSEPSFLIIRSMTDQPECCTEVPVTVPIATAAPGEGCRTCCSTTAVTNEWQGNFNGEFTIPITRRVTGGWTVEIYFSTSVNSLNVYNGNVIGTLKGNTVYQISNAQHNGDLEPGSENYIGFHGTISGNDAPDFYVYMVGQPQCCDTLCETSEVTNAPEPQETDAPLPTETPVEPTEAPVEPTETLIEPTEAPVEPTTHAPVEATAATVTLPRETNVPQETDAPTEPQHTYGTETTVGTILENAPYDYGDVIYKSILFYEAQRSGELPADNRIDYRGDSALDDMGDNGEDLTGGWYDAGDFVKFGHPMASSATLLAWGLVEYKDAYEYIGELDNMYDSLKWATDYFLKCHTGENEFYVQVGDGTIDHAYWGRPEEMNLHRPAFKVTPENPGSDVVAETAAALAAASIAFEDHDSEYSEILLSTAASLYTFAKDHRGKYSDVINTEIFYSSTSYNDELCWAAAWLYRATSNEDYLEEAEDFYDSFNLNYKPWAFDWDDKTAGVQVLLYKQTLSEKYSTAVDTFITGWVEGNDVGYTPAGLAWRAQWSPNRYSANVVLLALIAADSGINADSYREFAKSQINYMLGDNGRSYVVGFGVNPPDRPHHASSSCPDFPEVCNWDDFNFNGPNPQILYGALVGGPDQSDNFVNNRADYIQNEVACDYNAGFQSAVAGIIQLLIDGNYETQARK